jgi:hypothetical protein
MNELTFILIKWIAWLFAFVVLSNFLATYEIIINSRQPLSASGYMTMSTNEANLWNEGIIGYTVLSLIGLSAFMFGREILNLQKSCSLFVKNGGVGR